MQGRVCAVDAHLHIAWPHKTYIWCHLSNASHSINNETIWKNWTEVSQFVLKQTKEHKIISTYCYVLFVSLFISFHEFCNTVLSLQRCCGINFSALKLTSTSSLLFGEHICWWLQNCCWRELAMTFPFAMLHWGHKPILVSIAKALSVCNAIKNSILVELCCPR